MSRWERVLIDTCQCYSSPSDETDCNAVSLGKSPLEDPVISAVDRYPQSKRRSADARTWHIRKAGHDFRRKLLPLFEDVKEITNTRYREFISVNLGSLQHL